MQEKDFNKTEVKNNKEMFFGYEDGLVFPTDLSYQRFRDSMNLLLLIDDDSQWRN